MAKNKYYAYIIDNRLESSGITDNWDECKAIVAGVAARYKGFSEKSEAENWLKYGGTYGDNKYLELIPGIYFDAGTGRGEGVEVRVTDEKGVCILDRLVPKNKINKYGNYFPEAGSTNNYGELMGCYIALRIALKTGIMRIFGDSRLILDFWSKGAIKRDAVAEKTVELADMVRELRGEFENKGGTLEYVSGDKNPADLGFHK